MERTGSWSACLRNVREERRWGSASIRDSHGAKYGSGSLPRGAPVGRNPCWDMPNCSRSPSTVPERSGSGLLCGGRASYGDMVSCAGEIRILGNLGSEAEVEMSQKRVVDQRWRGLYLYLTQGLCFIKYPATGLPCTSTLGHSSVMRSDTDPRPPTSALSDALSFPHRGLQLMSSHPGTSPNCTTCQFAVRLCARR